MSEKNRRWNECKNKWLTEPGLRDSATSTAYNDGFEDGWRSCHAFAMNEAEIDQLASWNDGFNCPDCGHQHEGARLAHICIGCPCPRTQPTVEQTATPISTSGTGREK